MSQPQTKPAPHVILLRHFPVEYAGGILCGCRDEFGTDVEWAWHALGRIGLDADG